MKNIVSFDLFERKDLDKDDEIRSIISITLKDLNRAIQQGDVEELSNAYKFELTHFEFVINAEEYRKPTARYYSPNDEYGAKVEIHSKALYLEAKRVIELSNSGERTSLLLSPTQESALYHELVHFTDDFNHGLATSHHNMIAKTNKVIQKRYKKYKNFSHLKNQTDDTIYSIAKNDAEADRFKIYSNSNAETNAVFLQAATKAIDSFTPGIKFDEFWQMFLSALPWSILYYSASNQKRFKKRLYDMYIRKNNVEE